MTSDDKNSQLVPEATALPGPSSQYGTFHEDGVAPLEDESSTSSSTRFNLCKAIGPGMLVCLADTDAGCLIVAAQSGARWGYSLLLLQIILIPILFMAQELTVRLGVHTRQGHTACIRDHFGKFWACFACALLVMECIMAMMSEMSGVAAVGEMWGLGRAFATAVSAVLVVSVVFFLNYRQIETVGVVFGLFELTFVLTMFLCKPDIGDMFKGLVTVYTDGEYVKLVSANIGAVIMPWMIYFQQSAVVARRELPPSPRSIGEAPDAAIRARGREDLHALGQHLDAGMACCGHPAWSSDGVSGGFWGSSAAATCSPSCKHRATRPMFCCADKCLNGGDAMSETIAITKTDKVFTDEGDELNEDFHHDEDEKHKELQRLDEKRKEEKRKVEEEEAAQWSPRSGPEVAPRDTHETRDSQDSMPERFTVTVTKSSVDAKIGLDIIEKEGIALKVKHIKKDSPVRVWNATHSSRRIRSGDRIVEVNGLTGDAPAMLDIIANTKDLALVVERPW